MKKNDFLLLLDKLLEQDPGTLSGREALNDLPQWDSLALVGFIALVDEQFGVTFKVTEINRCKTVDDLAGLLDGKIET